MLKFNLKYFFVSKYTLFHDEYTLDITYNDLDPIFGTWHN